MPELPEVETTRRGILPHLLGQTVQAMIVRQPRLRWPIPADLPGKLDRQTIRSVERRGKYILIGATRGTLIVHLGMSGSLRILDPKSPPRKHDHLDLVLVNGTCLRFHDPRRFGCVIWTEDDPLLHPLLAELGPEPLSAHFDAPYLHGKAKGRSMAVKAFLMDSRIVVGVGNIYANEALFRAGIDPRRRAGRIALLRYEKLVVSVHSVLFEAIEQGGTTLRDFVNENGSPGYFQQTLQVYGRTGVPCRQCGELVRTQRLGQRSTYWCPKCQH
ncbi:bifunctional DNA-formamidopyrimidine glycosylase/DNA-(apurinic or apyrimidinic site) lyase [Methylocaldum sp.]|uniref:bifunctional DNA-formamidopyrimidine glycosylase/DNA-(apurinic or apyrimidinic site) lyase n=1 Tax=Methylocaldum sp. TaxID=1969727 RepID=UPI002D52E62D|nr:bifunctional DNA-formamidopyrimidine glycosylase/DNA-(apurinic or apyrimidinic site) lyase [Methylocaldum sp.]HYE35854.1 bifunctional DNA-formamidopyrimidine glycosylase/DNA-(apurinic or apyrimidinic site) lyase [Methylocaldum sp.]